MIIGDKNLLAAELKFDNNARAGLVNGSVLFYCNGENISKFEAEEIYLMELWVQLNNRRDLMRYHKEFFSWILIKCLKR